MPGGCTANGTLNEANFSKPLPTIGLYVAAASFLCAAGMAVDLFLGFRSRRLWFPCKYFTLNAATITILAVATKLAVDLNTSAPGYLDQLSKLSSTVLVCTVMSNLMPSVGVIDNPVSNIVALVILAVTVIVNVGIQMGTGVIYVYLPEHFVIIFFILVLLILFISSALTIATTKERLEILYDIKRKQLVDNVDFLKPDLYDESKLTDFVKRCWLMAHTSSPQYVLGRSVTCTASGAFCILSALTLFVAFLRSSGAGRSRFCKGTSDYGWSIYVVLPSQVVAIGFGTIAPALRWFAAVNYKGRGSATPEAGVEHFLASSSSHSTRRQAARCYYLLHGRMAGDEVIGFSHHPASSNYRRRNWRDELRVEEYWVQKLTELKEAPLSFQLRNWGRCQKIAHNSKTLILGFLIKAQTGVVLASKVVRLVSILPLSWLQDHITPTRSDGTRSSSVLEDELQDPITPTRSDDTRSSPDLEDFVLHLEGEDALQVKLISKLHEWKDVTERWIQKGKKKSPTRELADLIEKRVASGRGFIWVGRFDSNELVPSITRLEVEHCWALPVVTLASIAVGLADHGQLITGGRLKLLLSGVGQGLRYVRQIERNLEAKGLLNQRKAADIIWSRLELEKYCWFDVDLRQLFIREQGSPLKVVEALSTVGITRVEKFLEGRGGLSDTAKVWPPEVLAAHCMYRLTATILEHCRKNHHWKEHLSCCWLPAAVSDLLCACLTNLPKAIYCECFCNAIEAREESVLRGAALLLEEAEEIMRELKYKTRASTYPEETAYVDDWREKMGSGSAWSLHDEEMCSTASTDESVRHVELTQQQVQQEDRE